MTTGRNRRVVKISAETHPYRTELTPVSFLRRSAYVFPDKTAIVHGPRRYSYRQFEERANRLASGLRALGLRHLDRVAIIAPNTPAMLECHYGVPMAGAVLNTLNTRLDAAAIARGLNAMIDGLWLNILLDPKACDRKEALRACRTYLAQLFPREFDRQPRVASAA